MRSLTIPINLGPSLAGLDLKAQLLDSAGAPVGAEITAGFVEVGGGLYAFSYASFADDFQGAVEFIDDATELPVALAAVNPPPMVAVDAESLLEAPVAGYDAGTVGGVLAHVGTGKIAVTSHLAPGGDLYIIRGDSYLAENGNAIEFTDVDSDVPLPDLSGVDAQLVIQDQTIEGEIIEATETPKVIRFELTGAQTEALENRETRYALQLLHPGESPEDDEVQTIVRGRLIVRNATQ